MEYRGNGFRLSGSAGVALVLLLSTAVVGQIDLKRSKRHRPINCGFCTQNALHLPKPEYPDSARFLNVKGLVIVQVTVGLYGNVVAAKVISGHPFFHRNCKRAALRARFFPSFISGKRVRVLTTIAYNFTR